MNMEGIAAIFINTLAPVFATVISGLVSWGLLELSKYVRTKTKNEAINDAMSHICHTVDTTVKDLAQTTVKELKAASADGRLSKEDAMRIKTTAATRVRSQVNDKIQKTAAKGVTSLSDMIEAKVEKAVLELKQVPKVPKI